MFYRLQGKGISLEQMQQHNSTNGASEDGDHEGLCACESVEDLQRYIKSFACDPCSGKLLTGMDDDLEIVVFEGRKSGEVYDGALTYPDRIIERTTVAEFMSRN